MGGMSRSRRLAPRRRGLAPNRQDDDRLVVVHLERRRRCRRRPRLKLGLSPPTIALFAPSATASAPAAAPAPGVQRSKISLKVAARTVQTTVHMERKLTRKRQGLREGYHLPIPAGLPEGPPEAEPGRLALRGVRHTQSFDRYLSPTPPALGFRILAQSNAHGGTQSKGIKKASTEFRVGATELAARGCRAGMQLVPCGRKGRTGSIGSYGRPEVRVSERIWSGMPASRLSARHLFMSEVACSCSLAFLWFVVRFLLKSCSYHSVTSFYYSFSGVFV